MRETGGLLGARVRRAVSGVLAATVLAAGAACGDGGNDPIPVAKVEARSDGESLFIGETRQATAVTLDAEGDTLVNRRVSWSSSAVDVAEVSATGLITAKQAGTTRIIATSEGRQDTLSITVLTPVAAVVVQPEALTLDIGQERDLTVTVRAASGALITGRPVLWASTDVNVATVSEAGGHVRAQGTGSALIIASIEGKSDTAAVTVTSTVFTNCAGLAPLTLAVGEVRSLTGAERSAFCVSRGGSGDVVNEFALVSFNGAIAGQLQLSVEARGLTASESAPDPSRAPVGAPLLTASARAARGSAAFERDLRLRARRLVAPMAPAARRAVGRRSRTGGGASLSITAGSPAFQTTVGDLVTFNGNANGNGCTATPSPRTGRVAAVSTRAVVVADTANPANGFTDEEYQAFAAAFDTLVYPVDTENFGEPPDIDANARTVIFFTRAVNELTPRDADYIIGGFFFGRDLFPRAPDAAADYPGCAGSNEAEMFYMLVPDPTGLVNGNVRTKASVRDRTVSVLGHEFQHLINFGRRVYVNDAFEAEETWLDEALSHIAEELLFFRAAAATGLAPRQNITVEDVRATPARLDAVNTYQVSNLARISAYLEAPEVNSPYASDDELETRGAAWQFLRYLADRQGGDERALWQALVNSRIAGLENLQAVLGTDPVLVMRDWALANYLDDTGLTSDPLYSHASWSFRSMLPAITIDERYPLRVRQVASTSASVSLVAGGASYMRFGVALQDDGYLGLSSQGAPLPKSMHLMLVRTK